MPDFGDYLRTTGGYFGTKTAHRPRHPMYGYYDNAVRVASSHCIDADNLTMTVQIYDMNMKSPSQRRPV